MGKEKKKIPLINPLIRNKEINKEKKKKRTTAVFIVVVHDGRGVGVKGFRPPRARYIFYLDSASRV